MDFLSGVILGVVATLIAILSVKSRKKPQEPAPSANNTNPARTGSGVTIQVTQYGGPETEPSDFEQQSHQGNPDRDPWEVCIPVVSMCSLLHDRIEHECGFKAIDYFCSGRSLVFLGSPLDLIFQASWDAEVELGIGATHVFIRFGR